MDGATRKTDSIARRTRSYWTEYFRNCHNELKRKDQEDSGVGERSKRARDLVDSEPGRDGNGALESESAGILKIDEDFEDSRVGILRNDKVGGDVETLKCEEVEDNEDEGVEVSMSGDSGVEIFNCDEDNYSVDILKSDGAGTLKCDKDDNNVEMLKSDSDEISESDEDNGVDILSTDEDNSIDMLKSDGAGILKCDKDDNSVEMLKSDSDEILESNEDNGVDILRSDEDDGHGVDISKFDIYDNSGKDDDDDENSVEFLGEIIVSNDSSLKIETESISGSGLKVCDMDEVVSSLAAGFGNTTIEADSLGNSGGNAQLKPLDVEQIHQDISVDSDSSIGSRNSAEDSDGSDESVDSHVSESESTSEEDDESFDEDYKDDESSTSESSDGAYHDSDDRLAKDGKCGVGENENVMNEVEENLSDTVEDERTLGTHGGSMRNNLRKGSDTVQEKDDESGEGCNEDDHRTSHCKRSNERKSDDDIFMANVEKFSRARKSKPDLESDDEVDERERKRKSPRKNKKGDDKEETKSRKEKPELRKCSPPEPFEFASTIDKECRSLNDFFTGVKVCDQQYSLEKVKLDSKKSRSARDLDLIKILLDSIKSVKENQYRINENALDDDALPLKFIFEDEVAPPPEKPEWEKHIDSIFCDLELGLRESETDCTDNVSTMEDDDLKTTVEVDESIAACCSRGKHHAILDEQIGIICKYCNTLIMDIKHVLPPFHTPTQRRRDRQYYYDESPSSFFSEIQFQGSAAATYTSCTKGTVWDLIPGVEKKLYPHQREGFEFIWRNIAGDIIIEKLKQTLADDVRGCIISHAMGTGKTFLTIVFLQTFLKLYPACSPMIIAPAGVLLNWETEFKKWNFNEVFHNLNKKELSGKENVVATQLLGLGGCGIQSMDCSRLLKLYSWSRGGSILGISYTLFEKLARENGSGQGHEKIREVLLERTGLLVLDEGHTARNDRSLIWKALTKVTTQRRIILSGTPFQNNLKELYNTLCVVNPKYANQSNTSWDRKKWRRNLANRGDALKLRAMLDPFTHVVKGTILEESLPGLRHTLVFLHPTECQKTLLKSACQESKIFRRVRMVSLVSVHPSIKSVMKRYSAHHSQLEEIKSDIDAGVKMRFLMKLIRFSDALGERVLVFSQFIDSLVFIKEQLVSSLSWKEGREVLYMDGQLDGKKRQESISALNDETSEAKVLLASKRACYEGINLVGASRVVLLDTDWNPAVEKQAISRAYRIGQKKVVHVYHLFTSGIEVWQYAQQYHKERVSEWIFSHGDGQVCQPETLCQDRVLEAMLNLDGFNHIFEKIIAQPKESDLTKTFALHN